MIYMRQPGHWGVALWRDYATYGTSGGMGPGDPVPGVIELGPPMRTARENFRNMFVMLSNALGLRYWLVPCAGFAHYRVSAFTANVTAVLAALDNLQLLREGAGGAALALPTGPALTPVVG
jgi:hypothetical protein